MAAATEAVDGGDGNGYTCPQRQRHLLCSPLLSKRQLLSLSASLSCCRKRLGYHRRVRRLLQILKVVHPEGLLLRVHAVDWLQQRQVVARLGSALKGQRAHEMHHCEVVQQSILPRKAAKLMGVHPSSEHVVLLVGEEELEL